MCDMCGNDGPITDPVILEQRRQQMLRDEDERIRVNGYTARSVFPGRADQGSAFFYTVGRTLQGLPELLLTGALDPRLVMHLFADACDVPADQLVDGATITEIINGYGTRIMAVPDLTLAQMYGVVERYGDKATAVQLVWPDADGRYPGDPGFSYGDAQPLLGVWRG